MVTSVAAHYCSLLHAMEIKLVKLTHHYARRLSVERNSYSDVAGWLAGWVAGWVAGCLSQPVLYQND